MSDLIIILTGCFVTITCALLGCFLVLRKMAMIGDAISHSVLPGIVISYLLLETRDSIVMIVGAGIVGILTTVLIEKLHNTMRLQQDATIGVVFTTFFSLGVILISANAENIDLDQDCVLYGELAHIPLNTTMVAGYNIGPMALWTAFIMMVLVVSFIALFYRRLQLTTFDAGFATAIGISTMVWHYALMSMVSFATVISFESVGAILVVAFLIVPAATAYLITTKLEKMLLYSVGFSIASTVSGYYLAYQLDASIAGCMSVMAGVFFGVTMVVQKIMTTKYKVEVIKT